MKFPKKKFSPEHIALHSSMKSDRANGRLGDKYNRKAIKNSEETNIGIIRKGREENLRPLYHLKGNTNWRVPSLRNALCEKLIEWAKKPDSIVMKEFFVHQEISHKDALHAVNTYPEVKEAYDFALMCIGVNREKGALLKQLDGSIFRHSQWLYSDEWRKSDKYHSDLKKTTEENTGPKFVVVEKISDIKDV